MNQPRSHLGLVVYLWGREEQSRLVMDCLAPAVRELRQAGLTHFWFNRFDARGPHVFALFTLPAGEATRAEQLLAGRLEPYLGANPGRQELTGDDLAQRHRACRGATLCAVDAQPGFGERDSFHLFTHPPDGYPFSIGRGPRDAEALWNLLDDLTGWAVAQLAKNPDAPATDAGAALLAALAEALARRHATPEDYWRYHASTLLRRLGGLPDRHSRDEILGRLSRALGENNEARLAAAWAASGPPWPATPRLAELIVEEGGSGSIQPWVVLREIVHVALRQLAIPVRLELPLVLYAWKRSLSADAR
jgi:Lantibiotic biosynthesis dehydratase C-term